jgi:hypothetical protein
MGACRSILALGLAVLTAGCAAQSLSSHDGWYEARRAQLPKGNRLYICHAFTCMRTTPVQLSSADVAGIAGPLMEPVESPEAERSAIAQSVQTFERIIGERLGTSADRGGLDLVGAGDPRQMDCIDEATNTTSLLLLLSEQGYLRHHRIMHPVARGFFIDGRYPHATAVIGETASGARWAIDSWPRANAEPPVVQRLEAWLASRGVPPLGS